MSIQIDRPSPVDVTVQNPIKELYLWGNKTTLTSLRLVRDASGENIEFQMMNDGVWNDTGIQIAASTIHLGRDLRLSGAGDYLRTHDVNLDIDALAPHIIFTDAGTEPAAHVPILGQRLFNQIVQADFSVDTVAAVHGSVNIVNLNILGTGHRHKTGATAATSLVQISHYHGTDNTGVLFWQRNFPASTFPASSDVAIELEGMAEAFDGEDVYTEFVSDNAFSLLGSALPAPYTAWDFFPITVEDVMTSSTGMDRVLIDCKDGQTISDESGNLILSGAEAGGDHH